MELILVNSDLHTKGLIELTDGRKCKSERNEHFENQENQQFLLCEPEGKGLIWLRHMVSAFAFGFYA